MNRIARIWATAVLAVAAGGSMLPAAASADPTGRTGPTEVSVSTSWPCWKYHADRCYDRYGHRDNYRYGHRYGDRDHDRYGHRYGDRYNHRYGHRYGDRDHDRYGHRYGDRCYKGYGDRCQVQ
ncbi:hypothetical protein FHR83_008483 [Actinoplanes campanulatus]|uniref:Uncharacterized protein n=1 Tax=Actinoplanes campanulatus TaxID=113559 RepID=A0A7W5AQT4_9ACTN|nr:hypothetical protein [Actinoplanes campanulatus]MBB3100758.1 hypothetical protein [Actinoplanes campanulatus]GGN46180.1 hypothetical protein GCM10010109_81120 [Actinoplanes campanulatus]GID41180.1 hypothetical protein Aca09nite_76860 [Actinoplanes campanulatus]